MKLGKFGVFSYLDTLSAGEVAGFARKLEQLGYSALWFPETFGRDPFVCAAHVLGNTERLIAGAAVAVVWKRGAAAMTGASGSRWTPTTSSMPPSICCASSTCSSRAPDRARARFSAMRA